MGMIRCPCDVWRPRARCVMARSQICGSLRFECLAHYQGSLRNVNRFFEIVVDEATTLVWPGERV